jgi:hypothetical protein
MELDDGSVDDDGPTSVSTRWLPEAVPPATGAGEPSISTSVMSVVPQRKLCPR